MRNIISFSKELPPLTVFLPL